MNPLLGKLTILYIEDEPLIRQNAVEYLSRYCKEIYEASDGVSGLRAYETHSPDIVISDIKMPQMDGLEFVQKIREQDKKTPVILATAHTQTEYLLKAVELQLIKYIVKPITSDKLNEALDIACDIIETDGTHMVTLDQNIFYDIVNKTLFVDDAVVKLTHNEQLLFHLLATNHYRTVNYEEIEGLIWAYEGMSMDALRSLVRGLRIKLGGEFIENISGVGYRLIA